MAPREGDIWKLSKKNTIWSYPQPTPKKQLSTNDVGEGDQTLVLYKKTNLDIFQVSGTFLSEFLVFPIFLHLNLFVRAIFQSSILFPCFLLGSFLSESFFPNFSTLFSRNFLMFIFSRFFSHYIIGMSSKLIFLLLENFTNCDRTPPHIDACLWIFQTLETMEKTHSDKHEPQSHTPIHIIDTVARSCANSDKSNTHA